MNDEECLFTLCIGQCIQGRPGVYQRLRTHHDSVVHHFRAPFAQKYSQKVGLVWMCCPESVVHLCVTRWCSILIQSVLCIQALQRRNRPYDSSSTDGIYTRFRRNARQSHTCYVIWSDTG